MASICGARAAFGIFVRIFLQDAAAKIAQHHHIGHLVLIAMHAVSSMPHSSHCEPRKESGSTLDDVFESMYGRGKVDLFQVRLIGAEQAENCTKIAPGPILQAAQWKNDHCGAGPAANLLALEGSRLVACARR